MIRELFYRIKYRAFFQHPSGKKQFANWACATVISELEKPLHRLQETVRRAKTQYVDTGILQSDKEEKMGDLGASQQEPKKAPFEREVEELIKRKAIFNFWAVFLIVIAEAGLNYISMLIILSEEGISFEAVRLVLAFVATAVSVFIFDRMWVAWRSDPKQENRWAAIGWTLGGLIVLVLLYALSSARAADFEGEKRGIVYYGFIILSLILPVIAGWLWADREAILPQYRRLKKWKDTVVESRNFERSKASLKEEILARWDEFRTRFQRLVTDYWMVVNYFNTLKDGYNMRQVPPIKEEVGGTIAESFDAFKSKVEEWCEQQISQLRSELAEISIDVPLKIAKGDPKS